MGGEADGIVILWKRVSGGTVVAQVLWEKSRWRRMIELVSRSGSGWAGAITSSPALRQV